MPNNWYNILQSKIYNCIFTCNYALKPSFSIRPVKGYPKGLFSPISQPIQILTTCLFNQNQCQQNAFIIKQNIYPCLLNNSINKHKRFLLLYQEFQEWLHITIVFAAKNLLFSVFIASSFSLHCCCKYDRSPTVSQYSTGNKSILYCKSP